MTYPSGHDNPGVAAVILLLNEWVYAMDNGTVEFWVPHSAYVRPNGKKPWTEDQLDTLIRDIDAEIDQEVIRLPGTSVGAQAGPGFHRLALPQQLALAQALEQTIKAHREALMPLSPSQAAEEEPLPSAQDPETGTVLE